MMAIRDLGCNFGIESAVNWFWSCVLNVMWILWSRGLPLASMTSVCVYTQRTHFFFSSIFFLLFFKLYLFLCSWCKIHIYESFTILQLRLQTSWLVAYMQSVTLALFHVTPRSLLLRQNSSYSRDQSAAGYWRKPLWLSVLDMENIIYKYIYTTPLSHTPISFLLLNHFPHSLQIHNA